VLTAGTHTLKVRNTGMHNAASSGDRIDIDGVDLIMSGPEVSLLPSFNQLGIVSDGQRFGGGLDHHGAALSGNLLGSGATWVGVPFLFDGVG
jgi:hypothetical protein